MHDEDPNVTNLTETKSHRTQYPRGLRSTNHAQEDYGEDRDAIKWSKAALVGAVGSLGMVIFTMPAIGVGAAPFNMTPEAAFLERLGANVGLLPTALHFGYGAFWSVVLALLFGEKTTVFKGNALALGLWLVMMAVYSPIIGWGVFGFGGAGELEPSHPLYLESGLKYSISTLIPHIIYGSLIGWLIPSWIRFGEPLRRT